MAKIEIPLKKDYAGAFKYWIDTNTENGVCTIPEYICKGIVGMLDKQPVATDTNVGDTISRQAAIDALDVLCQEHRYRIPGKRETYGQYNEAWQDALDRAEGAIFNLPSAQPERPKGHWIVWGGMDIPENHGRHICSLCGEFAPVRYEKPLIKEYLSDFCPSCGADMRGEGNG